MIQQHRQYPREPNISGSNVAGYRANADSPPRSAEETLGKSRIRIPVRGKGPGILPLDHKENRRVEATATRGDQVLQMGAAPKCRCVRKEGDPLLYQRDRFHFHEAQLFSLRQQEVGTMPTDGRFPANDVVSPQTRDGAPPERIGHEEIRKVRIDRHVATWQTNHGEREASSSFRRLGRQKKHLPTGPEQFVQAT